MEYDLLKSYNKEERLRQRATSQFGQYTDDFLTMLTSDAYVNHDNYLLVVACGIIDFNSIFIRTFLDRMRGLLPTVPGVGDSSISDTTTPNSDNDNVIPTTAVETEPPDSGGSTTTTESHSSALTPSPGSGGNSPEELTGQEDESEGYSTTRSHEEIDGSHNKSVELDDDGHVAAAEGEERSANGNSDIDPSIPMTASGEGGVGGGSVSVDSYEQIDVINPGLF